MSTIAIVCEAPADRATVVAILDCVLSTNVDWYEPDSGFATFRGYLPSDTQLLWQDTKHLAKQQRVSVQGFMRGAPASPDAHNAKRALLLFGVLSHFVRCVIFVRLSAAKRVVRELPSETWQGHSDCHVVRKHGC